jgi:hypothetical protein
MKKRWPAIITVALLVAAFIALSQRERLAGMKWGQAKAATPEDMIWQMSDAARTGNVAAYLDCYSGALRRNLEKTATEMGEARFSKYLKQLNNEITGIAVSDLAQANAQEAELRVEFVFRGQTQAQSHHFRLVGGKWKIDAVETAGRVKVLIPDGTGVAEKE